MSRNDFIQLYKSGNYETIVIEYCRHFNLKNVDYVLFNINKVLNKILAFYFTHFEIVKLFDKENKLINIF